MGAVKSIFVFALAFAAAVVGVLTFMQEPFKTPVAAQLLFYHPPAIAVYWYVLGAFALGLFVGLLVSLSTWLRGVGKVRDCDRRIRELEIDLDKARIVVSADSVGLPDPAVVPTVTESEELERRGLY